MNDRINAACGLFLGFVLIIEFIRPFLTAHELMIVATFFLAATLAETKK